MNRLILFTLMGVLITPYTDASISIRLLQSPSLGLMIGGPAGQTILLNTNGIISGKNASDHIAGALEGRLEVQDSSASSAIAILVDNIYTTGGIEVTQVLCQYGRSAATRCDQLAASTTSRKRSDLLLGMEITTTATHMDGGYASVQFDVSVVYQ